MISITGCLRKDHFCVKFLHLKKQNLSHAFLEGHGKVVRVKSDILMNL